MPPPPSGLPFNAQPHTKYRSSKSQDIPSREKELSKVKVYLKEKTNEYNDLIFQVLEHATVRVIIPHDRFVEMQDDC